ncbi:MAG: hypothetical protein CM15mP118_3750 [Alphaproteobacteria bacterium]|nr:MAG: hypothetical protein CM15mP118_3750 [Alphaproteobacteria bacterium]
MFYRRCADAMTVEAVEPNFKNNTKKLKKNILKRTYHLTVIWRFAIIFGSLLVGLINLFIFKGIDETMLI